MGDLIALKGGNGEVPKLQDREPAVRKDQKSLYIGIDGKNEKVGDARWEDRIIALENQNVAIGNRLTSIETDIANIKARLDALTQLFATNDYVDGLVAGIDARLAALETPGE